MQKNTLNRTLPALSGASMLALAAAVSAVAAAPAHAQESDEIIVTAQRREQTLTEVPLSVQAISGEALENAQIENVTDLVRISPSIAFSKSFSSSSSGFLIRGVSSRIITGFTQPSSAVVVDGVPLALPGEFVSELSDIERVEVLRGPQGTLFGKNATAGVLNIITQRPVDEVEASATVGYTTDDEASARLMLNTGGGDTWVRINAFWRDLQPIVENRFPGDNDVGASEAWGLSAKLQTELSPSVSWLLSGDYREAQNSFGFFVPTVPSTGVVGSVFQIPQLGYTPTRSSEFVNINSPTWAESSGSAIVSELAWDATDALTITSITGYRQFEEDFDLDLDASPVGVSIGNPYVFGPTNTAGAPTFLPSGGYPLGYISRGSEVQGLFSNLTSTDYWSQELRANYSNGSMDLVAGVFYQTLDQDGNTGTPAIILNSTGTRCSASYCFFGATGNSAFGTYSIADDTWAVFGDVTLHLSDTVSAFGGLRYTSEEMEYNLKSNVYLASIPVAPFARLLSFTALDPVSGTISAPGLIINPLYITAHRDDNDTSGRAGLQWEPSDHQNFYVSYSRAYKGPGVDVSNAVSAATAFVGPETSTAWEIGAKQRLFDNHLMLNVSIFDEKIQDIQVSSTVPGTVQTRLLNAGDLELQGAEVEFRAVLTENLAVDGGASYIDGEHVGGVNACYDAAANDPRCFDASTPASPASRELISLTGLKPQNAPELRYSLNLNYEQQLSAAPFSLNARLGYNWQDEMPGAINGDPLTIIPAYGVLNASLTLSAVNGRWDITLFGKNLTDELVVSTMAASDGTVSRVFNQYGRDYRRYGGIQVRTNF